MDKNFKTSGTRAASGVAVVGRTGPNAILVLSLDAGKGYFRQGKGGCTQGKRGTSVFRKESA